MKIEKRLAGSLQSGFLFLLIMVQWPAQAVSYYFSSADGDDSRTSLQAQNPATPWKSLARLLKHSNSLEPSDNVLFKRGDIFVGTLSTRSGRAGAPINYGAYGIGTDPVISGFILLNSWTSAGGNIYYAALDLPRLQIVALDGVVQGMGRYPNSGFLKYTASNGNASISDPSVGMLPFDPVGGEAVVKKWRYILDRHLITSRTSIQLNLAAGDLGNNKSNVPTNGNGYFIQNHLATLDREGEWYYDKAAKRFYMHFGQGTPQGRTVQVGSIDSTIAASSKSHLTFYNLYLTGANVYGINAEYADHIVIEDCTFAKIGGDAIKCLQGGGFITVSKTTITDCLSGGITCEVDTNHVMVNDCTISNIHQIAGMGKSGDNIGTGITLSGDLVTAKDNSIRNVGYCGIAFYDSKNVSILRNSIDGYCNVKDDGGGIYSYESALRPATNKIIKHNTILNGLGNLEGIGAYTSYQNYGLANGIYSDGHTSHLTATSNTVAHSTGSGICINNTASNTLTDNLVYDCLFGLMIMHGGVVKDTIFTGNTIVARTAAQYVINVEAYAPLSEISKLGMFSNNDYARPADDGATVQIDDRQGGGRVITKMSLAAWKAAYSLDKTSNRANLRVAQMDSIRFESNPTSRLKIISLPGTYCDVAGNVVSGVLKLAPYSARVLLKP